MTTVAVVEVTAGDREPAGPTVARRLAAAGFDIALLGAKAGLPAPETVRWIEELGRRCIIVRAEPSDVDSVGAALETVRSTVGGPGVLVVWVGPEPVSPGPAEDACEDERRYVAVERALRPVFACGQAAAAHLMPYRWGRIVIVLEPTGTGGKAWSSGRPVLAGLSGFTRSAALELARFGITVNLVAPAGPETGAAGAYPEAVAHVTEFLAGQLAGGITGQEIYVGAAFSPQERQVR